MPGVEPRGESLRRAVRWVSDRRRDEPEADPIPWVHQAIARFDLDPAQADYLIAFFRPPRPHTGD